MEKTFRKTGARLSLSHTFSKYFLRFSDVPAAVPGTEVTAMSMIMLLPECDLPSERDTMEERSN